ncbi:MAG TPA: ABC transporter permease [Bryobacteraceae bacterium]|jgi:predicted permease
MWWNRADRDLAKELRFHIQSQVEENILAGMSPQEARRQAALTFGSMPKIQEECRDLRALRWFTILVSDVRYAARSLRASPVFALTSIASIALGIGVNIAIFTLMHAALWKPLPIPRPGELYRLARTEHIEDGWSFSWPQYEELRQAAQPSAQVFSRGAPGPRRFRAGAAAPERVIGEAVSGSYFSALEIKPVVGRLIELHDDQAPEPILVLSHSFWSQRFHSDASVIGTLVPYDEQPYRVIGVAQPGFRGIDAGIHTDVWVPVKVAEARWVADADSSRWLAVMARASNPRAAQSVLAVHFQRYVAERLIPRATLGRDRAALAAQHLRLVPASSGLASEGEPYQGALSVLLAIVGVVLLIACANVANLMLARNVSRRQEFAVRIALGAGRLRLAGHLLSESALISITGAAAGLLLGCAGSRLILSLLPPSRIPLDFDLRPDTTVIAFSTLLVMLTAILTGCGPVWRAWRSGVEGILDAGMRVTERGLTRKLLVVAQLALSLMLITGSGLFLRTLYRLATTDLGFRPERIMAFEIGFPRAATGEHRARVARVLFDRLSAIQGLSVTFTSPSVYENGRWSRVISSVDGRKLSSDSDHEVQLFGVGPEFFETLGIGLLAGRTINTHDNIGSTPVVVVNQTFARQYLSQGAIGHFVDVGARKPVAARIVGVVRDIRHQGVKDRVWPVIYLPALQLDGLEGTLLVRSTLQQVPLLALVTTELRLLDASARIEYTSSLETAVNSMISRERLIAYLSAAFGALAVLLAAVGLYGVMAYNMSRRTPEIGIRMALGARPEDIRALALRESLRLAAAGVALGLLGSLAAGRFVRSLLFDTSSTDPRLLGAAILLMAAVALSASWLPAVRAARTDPNSALRRS